MPWKRRAADLVSASPASRRPRPSLGHLVMVQQEIYIALVPGDNCACESQAQPVSGASFMSGRERTCHVRLFGAKRASSISNIVFLINFQSLLKGTVVLSSAVLPGCSS